MRCRQGAGVSEKTVLVTGASSGFGKACAELLQEKGYDVYGTSRRGATAATPFQMLQMDVDDDASVRQGIDAILRKAGRLDAVVNNAGIGFAGAVEDTSIEEARAQFETNFFGVLRVCRAVLPIMRAQRSGMIINVSSLGGLIGIPFQALYSASKFALEGLSEALRMEVRPWGIHVVLVEPGDARTGFTASRRRTAASAENPAYRERLDKCLAVMETDETNGFPPEKVARRVERILRSRAPRLRYVVAPLSQSVPASLKKYVPWALFEWGFMKVYRLR